MNDNDKGTPVSKSPFWRFSVKFYAVPGVALLDTSTLHPALPTHTGVRERYLRGLTADHLAVLDGARLLGDPRIVVSQAAA